MSALWTLLGLKPYVIDLSHHNVEPVDFAALAADGVRMVIHKATQGSRYIDPLYAPRRKAAEDAGLLWEAYHFADASPVADQLTHFLAVAEFNDLMRGAIDIEPYGSATIKPAAADMLVSLLDQQRGRQCLRYTGAGYLTPDMLVVTQRLRAGPLWWAKYGPMMTRAQLDPLGIDPARIVLWQETESGQRAGVAGNVDESYWLGTGQELDGYPNLPATYPV